MRLLMAGWRYFTDDDLSEASICLCQTCSIITAEGVDENVGYTDPQAAERAEVLRKIVEDYDRRTATRRGRFLMNVLRWVT